MAPNLLQSPQGILATLTRSESPGAQTILFSRRLRTANSNLSIHGSESIYTRGTEESRSLPYCNKSASMRICHGRNIYKHAQWCRPTLCEFDCRRVTWPYSSWEKYRKLSLRALLSCCRFEKTFKKNPKLNYRIPPRTLLKTKKVQQTKRARRSEKGPWELGGEHRETIVEEN